MTPKMLLHLLLFGGTVMAVPSLDHGGLDTNAILPFGGVLNPTSQQLEIRGVYGGRKKRYIVERADDERRCCNKKTRCKTLEGAYLNKDCNCEKCKTGVPAPDGQSCVPACPKGQVRNEKGGCCPEGQKLKPSGDACEKKDGEDKKPQCQQHEQLNSAGNGCEKKNDKDEEEEKKRKGKCPDGSILDPKEGPQKADELKPKCVIDDSRKCPPGKIPRTRFDGDENDASVKVECGTLKNDSERPKCDVKKYYTKVTVWSDGSATEECYPNRQFEERKRKKPQQLKEKLKKKWDEDKPARDKRNKERNDAINKIKERKDEFERRRKEAEKIQDINDRKKERMGKCAPVAALMLGLEQSKNADENHPYDWTSDWFDEAFIGSDERLADWPKDINVDNIKNPNPDVGVDPEEWMKRWEEKVAAKNRPVFRPACGRSLESRCPMKRFTEYFDVVDEGYIVDGNQSFVEEHRDRSDRISTRTDIALLPLTEVELSSRTDVSAHPEKRFFPFVAIFIQIGAFAARLGMSLLARTAAQLARWAPRLANLSKNSDRLFKVAETGKGAARGGVEGMKNAWSQIVKNPNFRKCVIDALP